MKTIPKYYSISKLFLIVLIFLLTERSFAQNINIRNNSFYYPHSLEFNEVIQTLGLSSAKLPEDVVETDDIFRAPLLFYRIKYGLPYNFISEAGFESNFLTFHLSLGTQWNHEFGKLSMSLGTDAAYWYGRLYQFGFDTNINGWHLYPNLSVGYSFTNFSVTVKSEALFILAQSTKTGDIKVSSNFDTFSGYAIGVYIEQPLWKDNFVVIGFKSNFTKFYYPMWATFSTFDRFFYISEFVFSFNL